MSTAYSPDNLRDFDERTTEVWGVTSTRKVHEVNVEVHLAGSVDVGDEVVLRVNGRVLKRLAHDQAVRLGLLTGPHADAVSPPRKTKRGPLSRTLEDPDF